MNNNREERVLHRPWQPNARMRHWRRSSRRLRDVQAKDNQGEAAEEAERGSGPGSQVTQ